MVFVWSRSVCVVWQSEQDLTPELLQKLKIDQMKGNRRRNSRTLFIMITASLVLWIPGILVKCTHFLCLKRVPLLLVHVLNFFHSATFLVNPIIYSLRIPMVRETFKREKLCMQSKKYSVNYTP